MAAFVTVHASTTSLTRRETLGGRAYCVAPVVPIVAGVLNDYLVPREEIAAFVEAWNGIPLPVGHPQNDYGEAISANSPSLSTQHVGQFFHARMDGPRLVGELWLDIARCETLGGAAQACLTRLEAGEPLEVSTAFFAETVAEQGIYNGVRYVGIRRGLRPDHLALLPDAVGACDWRMGCGAPRTHQQGGCRCQEVSMDEPAEQASGRFRTAINTILAFASSKEPAPAPLAAHLTHDDLRMALYAALAERRGMMYGPDMIMDVLDDGVIYRDGERLFQQTYTIDAENRVTFTGEPVEVQRDTRYIPLATTTPPTTLAITPPPIDPQKGQPMPQSKADLIQALIAHPQTVWNEADMPTLESLGEPQLVRLMADATAREGTGTVSGHAPLTAEDITTLLRTELDARDQALEARLTAHVQHATEQQERTQLTAHMVAQGFSAEECAAMPLVTLRKVAQTVAPTSYAGLGFPAFPQGATDENLLPDDDPKWT